MSHKAYFFAVGTKTQRNTLYNLPKPLGYNSSQIVMIELCFGMLAGRVGGVGCAVGHHGSIR